MRTVALAMVALLLLASTPAFGGNAVKQSVTMSSNGGYISQSAANAAVVMGSNNQVNQGVTQTASGRGITQSGANAVVVVGNNSTVIQGVGQSASGQNIAQSGANALAVVGNNNYANQQVAQAAVGQNIFQNGWNTGTIVGDGNALVQGLLAYAENIAPADPNQTMSNSAYIAGSYNGVNQQVSGYILAGAGSGPSTQVGSNYVQGHERDSNAFDQGLSLVSRNGGNVMQSGNNQVRIGPS